MTLVCPHRRYHREATHYRCVYCGETLPLGEAETEVVATWADGSTWDDEMRGRYLNRFGGP